MGERTGATGCNLGRREGLPGHHLCRRWCCCRRRSVKETAKAAAEVAVEIVKRVRKNRVVQTIGKGVDSLKKLKDAKELPGAIRRTIKCVWAFATGEACFSWVASSFWCTLCSAGYAILLVTVCVFSLYLLGLL